MSSIRAISKPIKYQITLPKINFKKVKNRTTRMPTKQVQQLQQSYEQSLEELSKLDEWSNSLPTVKRKRNNTQSIMYLYKSYNKYNANGHGSKFGKSKQGLVAQTGLYLAQLDNEMNKIRKINYDYIYQNVQYCAGVYQIAFNDIFKKIQTYRKNLQESLVAKLRSIEEYRQKKINEIRQKKPKIDCKSEYQKCHARVNSRQSTHTNQKNTNRQSQASQRSTNKQKVMINIANNQKSRLLMEYKQQIEQKQKQLKPVKLMLAKLQKARSKVLHFCLQLGFDVRQQGIIWILKQLNNKQEKQLSHLEDQFNSTNKENLCNKYQKQSKYNKQNVQNMQKCKYIPKLSQFPNFLTEQQIKFIISKFRNDFKLKAIEQQKLEKQEQQKQILHTAFQNVRRDRNRKLSMIRQKQLLSKLLQQKHMEIATGHKYINSETVKLMQNSQKIKYTNNQLVYQQTLKKLNRFCIKQIYSKKSKNNQSNSSQIIAATSSCNIPNLNSTININLNGNSEKVHRLMTQVQKMLAQANKLKDKQQKIKTEEQKQFADIMMKLRNQRYQGRLCSQKRNPINVIACLVGWKKAKKILQNQMNISMPASSTQN